VCEVCLGPNPYVRMLKMPNSRECKISGRPYTAFRWKPGSEARYKETIVAAEVAIAKNVCQVCLMDMEYNLPVAVRDQLTGAGKGGERGVGGVQMPGSDVNKEFYWENQRQSLAAGTLQGYQELNAGGGAASVGANFEKLAALSRNNSHTPYYDRNLPKLCSFWARQTCNRVANGSCPYRPCCGVFRFPELASTQPELLSTLVRKLHAEGALGCMRDTSDEMEEIREALRDSQRGSRNEAIRNRYHGTEGDKLAAKYLDKAQSMAALTPPEDQGVVALWVGGLTADITQQDLRDAFYAYGEIAAVRMKPERRCALIEYTLRKSAEEAATALHRRLAIKGARLKLWWAKSQQAADNADARKYVSQAYGAPVPPPGEVAAFGAAGGASLYPSMNPSAMGARPDAR